MTTAAESTRQRAPRLTHLVMWSAISGLAMAFTFPPAGWWWLGVVAYVPLLWCWRRCGPARAALCGCVFGVTGFGVVCVWMWFFGAIAFGPFLIGMAAFPALTGYTLALLRGPYRRGPWIEAAVWVAFEGLRDLVPFGGMPWATAGSALAPFAPARALAPWGGVLLASYLLIALNGLILDIAEHRRAWRRDVRPLIGVGVVIAITALATVAWPSVERAGTLRFALLQGNDLNRRLTPAEEADNFLAESHLALADTLSGPYDLIVFPESSLGDADPETDPRLHERIAKVAAAHNSWVMLNVNEQVGETTYNTNRIYAPDGTLVASYRKRHLVPFGEYIPFTWVKSIAPGLERVGSGYAPGAASLTVPIAGHPLTTVICFESAFSSLVRESASHGAQGVVLSTNNRSYRRSANSAQHVQLSQWRAAELGKPVLHAAISGISASVDARGRVRQESALFERTILTGETTLRRGSTPYARLGNWPLLACILVVILGLLATLAGDRIRRRTS